MTLEETKAKRSKAISLLEQHEDSYRILYVEANALKPEDTNSTFWFKRSMAKVKSELILQELEHLDTLIEYRKKELEDA